MSKENIKKDLATDITYYSESLNRDEILHIVNIVIDGATIEEEKEEPKDSEILGNSISAAGSLTAYLAWQGEDFYQFPRKVRKKLEKFMQRYDKLYKLLTEEGIFFDYD